MDLEAYWKAVLTQDEEGMKPFFAPDALVKWHNTNECFSAEEFIRANCAYPGNWDGEIQRVEEMGDLIVTVVRVFSREEPDSLHVTSLIRIEGDKIASLDEYWGEDGPPPQWRQDLRLGRPIL